MNGNMRRLEKSFAMTPLVAVIKSNNGTNCRLVLTEHGVRLPLSTCRNAGNGHVQKKEDTSKCPLFFIGLLMSEPLELYNQRLSLRKMNVLRQVYGRSCYDVACSFVCADDFSVALDIKLVVGAFSVDDCHH